MARRGRQGGWAGMATVYEEFERFLVGRKFLTEEQAKGRGVLVYVEVEFEGKGYYEPAKLDGYPEDCYPAEGETLIDEQAVTSVHKWNNKRVLAVAYDKNSFKLTKKEEEFIEDSMSSACADADDRDYDFEYDY